MHKRYILILLSLLTTEVTQAQDPQFTQFYAAPLYLNPAFSGSALAPRVTINYRNQWPAVTNYVTSMIGIDHHLERYNSGIGILFYSDNQKQNQIRSTELALQYSYQFSITDQTAIRLGLQGSYSNRTVNWFGLTFGDQYTNQGFTGNPTTDPIVANGLPTLSYLDFSTGGLLYSDWYWIGVSAHHLNRPSLAYVTGDGTRLPIKGSIHTGLRIPFAGFTGLGDEWERERTISPTVNYRFQGKFDQLDLGLYMTYSPMVIGAWYRGLPLKKYAPTVPNSDALAILVGYRQDNFSIGYSYDTTISTLGIGSGGSHEISLSYTFDTWPPGKKKSRRRDKQLSCPKF